MAVFPTINNGVITQLPWSVADRFRTVRNDQPTGQRYAYAERDTPLRRWELNFSLITDAELEALRSFFAARKGRWETFDFVDPDTLETVPNCRFGMDSFEWQQLGKDQNSCRVVIEETA